ncbi:MAG: division/cell wall cluster transcriptional repressor MraZ [Bacteroidetes bacterium]|nr:division/cell wall cluster transcriptional repressor MraZ [Bacteroidota bacterium]
MTNFIGDYQCKIDAKGRITFPSAFKKQITGEHPDKFVIKKDIYEKCLVLYTLEEWERQNELIKQQTNPYNKEHNRFLREFFKGTAELALDANNRLLIPKRLHSEIGDVNEVVLAGQFNKIEVWAKADYESLGNDEDEFADLANKILGGKE